VTYRIALRHDDLGLDDVVVKDVSMFRMERMDDDHVWLACYLTGGEDLVIDLWVEGGVVKYAERDPLPNVTYEGGTTSVRPSNDRLRPKNRRSDDLREREEATFQRLKELHSEVDQATWFARVAAGYDIREELIERLCDRLVELWHDGAGKEDEGLDQFMGLSPEQYAAYVEQRYEDIDLR
jgi:hypothetical protein